MVKKNNKNNLNGISKVKEELSAEFTIPETRELNESENNNIPPELINSKGGSVSIKRSNKNDKTSNNHSNQSTDTQRSEKYYELKKRIEQKFPG